jgi:hypothetical protein
MQVDAATPDNAAAEDDLLTIPMENLTTVDQIQSAMDAPGVSKTRKQKLKQKLNAMKVCSLS